MKKRDIILISGPTASGKSGLALEIAGARNATIVNADALQVYRSYRVLTARPSLEDEKKVPHQLYGYVDNISGYSVGRWLRDVTQLIEYSQPLVIVGGTGLYFSALLSGLAEIPEIGSSVVTKNETALLSEGLGVLAARLQSVDPELASRMDLQNGRRVLRALNVYDETGVPLSVWQARTPPAPLRFEDVEAYLVMPDYETTNQRIEARFDLMLQKGAIAEVEAELQDWDPERPANKALGAVEIAAYIQGHISLDEARRRTVIATRQYAKRQRSWFRARMKHWRWLERARLD